MLKNIYRLFAVLDRWKSSYIVASILMMLALFVRSLEPKVLQFAVDSVVGFSGSGQESTSPDIVLELFSKILPEISAESLTVTLVYLGIVYMVISFLRGGFLMAGSALTASSTEKAIKYLRDRLFAHIQRLPMQYFTKVSRGELTQRSTGDIDTVRRFVLGQVVEIIRLTAIFLFSFAMMYMIHPLYAFISVALCPIMMITSFLFFQREGKVWREHEDEADKLNSIVQENLNGIRVVQAFANEDAEMKKFDDQNLRKRGIGVKHVRLHAIFWPFSDFLVNLQITAGIIAGGYFAATLQISIGALLSFYAYIFMVAWPLRQLGRVLSQMGMAVVAIERIYEVLDAKEEKTNGAAIEAPLLGKIEFRNVSFSYTGDQDERVLKNISFTVHPGERIALIGPTGSGKTTVAHLLLGLYDVDTGEIRIDGMNINSLSRRELRKRIGIALQSPFLFSTSVMDNITYASGPKGETEIEQTAQTAAMDRMKSALPEGFNTLVGEKGVSLSGGQKQRVALARTILDEPDMLVLDDITSAVDTETESAILEGLDSLMTNKTALIISHRVSAIQKADRLLVLDLGELVQAGTLEELAKKPGYYQQINQIQSELESNILNA